MAAGPRTQYLVTLSGVGPAGNGDTNDIETLTNTYIAAVAAATGQTVTFAKYAMNVPTIARELVSGHEKQLYP